MEDNYIILSKWDLEKLIIGSCVYVDGKRYYMDDIHIQEATGYTRDCTCVFYESMPTLSDDDIYYIFNYSYDEYNDEITIREPKADNFEGPLAYYKIRKANSRKIIEYY